MYCDIADVQALNPTRNYGPQTTPTADQVRKLCDLRSAELDAYFADMGIAAPIPAEATVSFGWARACAAYGAAMDAEAAMFPSVADRKDDSPHMTYLRKRYESMLKSLFDGNVKLSDAPRISGTSRSRSPLGPGVTPATSGVGDVMFARDMTGGF